MLEDDDLETFKKNVIKQREENRAQIAFLESINKQESVVAALNKKAHDLFREIGENRKRENQESQQDEKNTAKF